MTGIFLGWKLDGVEVLGGCEISRGRMKKPHSVFNSGLRWFQEYLGLLPLFPLGQYALITIERSVLAIGTFHDGTDVYVTSTLISSDYRIILSLLVYCWHPLNAPTPTKEKVNCRRDSFSSPLICLCSTCGLVIPKGLE